MNAETLRGRLERLLTLSGGILLLAALAGCGSSEEAYIEEQPDQAPVVSEQAKLQYKVDSLMNENRRLTDQIDAVTSENRKLTAKNAELETKLTETATAPPPKTPAMIGAGPTAAYNAALDMFNSRNYSGAIEQFQGLLNSGSAGDLADNCQYWIGESYYGMGKYQEALKNFQLVLDYKRSGKIPYALLMSGNCEAALGNKAAAVESYQRVMSEFPTSPVAEKAKGKLGKMR
jgi:tol-pal system protein YbgF